MFEQMYPSLNNARSYEFFCLNVNTNRLLVCTIILFYLCKLDKRNDYV